MPGPRALSLFPGVWLPVLGSSSLILVLQLRALFGKSQPALKTAIWQKASRSLSRVSPKLLLGAPFKQFFLCPLPQLGYGHPAALSILAKHPIDPDPDPNSHTWLYSLTLDLLHHYRLIWQSRLLAKHGLCFQICFAHHVPRQQGHCLRWPCCPTYRFTSSSSTTCAWLVPDR